MNNNNNSGHSLPLDGGQVLSDWERFLWNGFRYEDFTPALHHWLTTYGGFRPEARPEFWGRYFDSTADMFIRFVNQFGGDRTSVNGGDTRWLGDGERRRINEALCAVMEDLSPPRLLERLAERARAEYRALRQAEVTAEWARQGGGAEALSNLYLVYDTAFPLESFLSGYRLDGERRAWLVQALREEAQAAWLGQPDLFAVRRHRASLARQARQARQARRAAVRQEEAVEAAPPVEVVEAAPPVEVTEAAPPALADDPERAARIARLSATEEEIAEFEALVAARQAAQAAQAKEVRP